MFSQIVPSIRIELLPVFQFGHWVTNIDSYGVNSYQVMTIAVTGTEPRTTKILMYNRLTQVWSCSVDNLPQVKGSFFDKRGGKVYLFSSTAVMCYDVVNKDFNDCYIKCDQVVPDYEVYRQSDVEMVCKNDEAHILLIQNHVARQYIIWNFVTKARVFVMGGVICVSVNGCRLFFTKWMDTPRIFAFSNIYELEKGVWTQLEFNEEFNEQEDTTNTTTTIEKYLLSSIQVNLNPNRTVATECGRYVISFMSRDAVIFDTVSKQIKSATVNVDWRLGDKAVYFHDDGKLLTAAFVHHQYQSQYQSFEQQEQEQEQEEQQEQEAIFRGFPSYLVDYIAKWVAQEWIFFCPA